MASMRVMADVLGLPVKVPKVKESTALGAAMFAGIGAGEYEVVAAAGRAVAGFETTIEPDGRAHERYQELYRSWSRVYAGEVELSERGLLVPLRRAAGT